MFGITKTHVRFTLGIIAAVGVAYVAKEIIEENTSDPENYAEAAQLLVGTAVIGSMVAVAAEHHIHQLFDEVTKSDEPVPVHNITSL